MEITWLLNIALPYDSYDVSDEPRDYPNPLSGEFASFVNGCKIICIIFFSVSIRCRPFLLVLLKQMSYHIIYYKKAIFDTILCFILWIYLPTSQKLPHDTDFHFAWFLCHLRHPVLWKLSIVVRCQLQGTIRQLAILCTKRAHTYNPLLRLWVAGLWSNQEVPIRKFSKFIYDMVWYHARWRPLLLQEPTWREDIHGGFDVTR